MRLTGPLPIRTIGASGADGEGDPPVEKTEPADDEYAEST